MFLWSYFKVFENILIIGLIWLYSTKIFAKRQQHIKLLTKIQVILLKIRCKQNTVNVTVSYMFQPDL